jgi:hypothetical protein
MFVNGIGFNSGQTVVSASGTVVVLSAPPDSTPTGAVIFTSSASGNVFAVGNVVNGGLPMLVRANVVKSGEFGLVLCWGKARTWLPICDEFGISSENISFFCVHLQSLPK